MLKKTITYTNFNDEEVSEDFFFHLSKAELVELEMSQEGGLSETLKRIVAAENGKEIIAEFKNIILTAYGKRSDDGRRFIKNQELRDEFVSTEAYSVLFMELATDTNAAIEFINGVVPKGLAEEAAEVVNQNKEQTPAQMVLVPEPKTITKADITGMSREELAELGPKLVSGEVVIKE